MVKWVKLTRNQNLGFFAMGLAFFALQELPYLVMPLIPLSANPLMEMQDKYVILNTIEKVLGVSCIVTMLLLVRSDAKWFSLNTRKEKAFFCIVLAALAGYYIGWIFYFSGFQGLPLILFVLVALPPIYYSFIGLWRKNYALVVLGSMFLVTHMANVWSNLK